MISSQTLTCAIEACSIVSTNRKLADDWWNDTVNYPHPIHHEVIRSSRNMVTPTENGMSSQQRNGTWYGTWYGISTSDSITKEDLPRPLGWESLRGPGPQRNNTVDPPKVSEKKKNIGDIQFYCHLSPYGTQTVHWKIKQKKIGDFLSHRDTPVHHPLAMDDHDFLSKPMPKAI